MLRIRIILGGGATLSGTARISVVTEEPRERSADPDWPSATILDWGTPRRRKATKRERILLPCLTLTSCLTLK